MISMVKKLLEHFMKKNYIETSKLAAKSDLVNLKVEVDKLDIEKLKSAI